MKNRPGIFVDESDLIITLLIFLYISCTWLVGMNLLGRFRDSLRVDRTNESRPDSSSGCEDSFGAKFGARFCRVKRSDSEHFDECCYFHFHFPSLPLILSTSLRLFIMAEKRVTRKFAVEEDICLLKEVIALGGDNPFLKSFGSETWLSVSRAVAVQHPKMEGLSGRAAKERAEKIVKEGRAKENWRARQSGTDEQFGRKEAALVGAINLLEEAVAKRSEATEDLRRKEKKDEEMRARAKEIREGAFATLKRKSSGTFPSCLCVPPTFVSLQFESQMNLYVNSHNPVELGSQHIYVLPTCAVVQHPNPFPLRVRVNYVKIVKIGDDREANILIYLLLVLTTCAF